MAVSKRLRFEIFRRDNHTCRYCGVTASDAKLTVDHVTPVSLGGADDISNLVTACVDCNSGKSATPPTAPIVADVAQSALRWAAALQLAAERQAAINSAAKAEHADILEEFECVWTATWLNRPGENDTASRFRHPDRHYAPRPKDWSDSLDRMLAAGLARHDLTEAVLKAMRANWVEWEQTWRYFCGVAWGMLRERQEIARELLDSGEI